MPTASACPSALGCPGSNSHQHKQLQDQPSKYQPPSYRQQQRPSHAPPELTAWFEVQIDDSGEGLKGADPEVLFSDFKADDSKSGPTNGLGLPVCRVLAEKMGGSLELSDRLDQRGHVVGARFSLRLPYVLARPPIGRASESSSEEEDDVSLGIAGDELWVLLSDDYDDTSEDSSPNGSNDAASNRNISAASISVRDDNNDRDHGRDHDQLEDHHDTNNSPTATTTATATTTTLLAMTAMITADTAPSTAPCTCTAPLTAVIPRCSPSLAPCPAALPVRTAYSSS